MELSDGKTERASGDRRLTVIARDAASGKWRLFERPLEIVTAMRVEDVRPALEKIEAECARNGRYAAGFVSYEASPAFDGALTTQPPDRFPLVWFGIYEDVRDRSLEECHERAQDGFWPWTSSVSAERYAQVFEQIQNLIRRRRHIPGQLHLSAAHAADVGSLRTVLCSSSPRIARRLARTSTRATGLSAARHRSCSSIARVRPSSRGP